MKFTLNITDWQSLAPGLSEAQQWQAWSRQPWAIDPAAPLAKLSELPMMTARRLSSGSKLAVECGLAMLRRHQPDAVLYTVGHGELERNYRIVHALATEQALSPTDFALSVHNSSVGNLTVTKTADRFSHRFLLVATLSSKVCVKCLACYKRDTSAC